jgi:hypothetical protein
MSAPWCSASVLLQAVCAQHAPRPSAACDAGKAGSCDAGSHPGRGRDIRPLSADIVVTDADRIRSTAKIFPAVPGNFAPPYALTSQQCPLARISCTLVGVLIAPVEHADVNGTCRTTRQLGPAAMGRHPSDGSMPCSVMGPPYALRTSRPRNDASLWASASVAAMHRVRNGNSGLDD